MNKKLRYALKHKKSAGQAIVEYIIIVAIVAIGALTVKMPPSITTTGW